MTRVVVLGICLAVAFGDTGALAQQPPAAGDSGSAGYAALTEIERNMIRIACSGLRSRGPAHYENCVRDEVAALARSPGRPDLSTLPEIARDRVRLACSGFRSRGPARYWRCLRDQIAARRDGVERRWPSWRAVSAEPGPARPGAALSPLEVHAIAARSVWLVVAGKSRGDFRRGRGLAQGSAVAVSPRMLVTNCHVVTDRPLIAVTQGKKTVRARLDAADPKTDRCVLAVDKPALAPVRGVRRFGDLRIGEPVYSIGNPRGLEKTLGQGIVSGLRTTRARRLVQTTAPISPGSSGGGLFDGTGNLVGVTSFVVQGAQSINFAIAAEDFWR